MVEDKSIGHIKIQVRMLILFGLFIFQIDGKKNLASGGEAFNLFDKDLTENEPEASRDHFLQSAQ